MVQQLRSAIAVFRNYNPQAFLLRKSWLQPFLGSTSLSRQASSCAVVTSNGACRPRRLACRPTRCGRIRQRCYRATLPRCRPPLPAAFFGQHSLSRAWTSSSAPPARSARRLPNHLRLVGELAAIEGRVDEALADLPANVSEECGLDPQIRTSLLELYPADEWQSFSRWRSWRLSIVFPSTVGSGKRTICGPSHMPS